MPLLTRVTIRLGMTYLLVGLAGWFIYWADLTWDIPANWSALRIVSVHFIAVGWLTQLIFAVMLWMFPILSRETPYGRVWIGWFGLVNLNLGLVARAFFEIGIQQGFPQAAGWGLVGAAILQWMGVTAWIILLWGRVQPKKGKGRGE